MFEREDLLDGDLSVRRLVESSDDGAVCAFTETVEDLVIVTCERETGAMKGCQSWF